MTIPDEDVKFTCAWCRQAFFAKVPANQIVARCPRCNVDRPLATKAIVAIHAYWRIDGGHAHVKMYTGWNGSTMGCIGDLTMTAPEFFAFKAGCLASGAEGQVGQAHWRFFDEDDKIEEFKLYE